MPQAAAARLRSHARERLEASWQLLEQEFNVQTRVWDSLGLSRGARHQGHVAILRSKLEYAMAARKRSHGEAVEALEEALRRQTEDTHLMSKDMAALVASTLNGERTHFACGQLADGLEALAAAEPSDTSTTDTLIALLPECELEHPKLEGFIRKALGVRKATK